MTLHLSMLAAGCDTARGHLSRYDISESQIRLLVEGVWTVMERKRVTLEPIPLNAYEMEALSVLDRAFTGSTMCPVGLFRLRDLLKAIPAFGDDNTLIYATLGMFEARGLIRQPTDDGESTMEYFPTSRGKAAVCLAKGDREGFVYWAGKPETATVATVIDRNGRA